MSSVAMLKHIIFYKNGLGIIYKTCLKRRILPFLRFFLFLSFSFFPLLPPFYLTETHITKCIFCVVKILSSAKSEYLSPPLELYGSNYFYIFVLLGNGQKCIGNATVL